MATLPTVPSFVANEVPTVAKLNQLSNAASFVSQVPIVVSLKKNATQAVTASTNTAVIWDVNEVDTDSMQSTITNPSRLTAKTQGYYKLHATISANVTAVAAYTSIWFQQTTGANNPKGAGVTQIFGAAGSLSGVTTTDFKAFTISSLTPCLFINDYVEVFIFSAVAVTIQTRAWSGTANNDTAGFADGSPCLYGTYAFEGP